MEKVVLFGNANFAVMNYFYLAHDSPYQVIAFTVDGSHIKADKLYELPVVPFEEIERLYPPDDFKLSIPLGMKRVNKLRAEKYFQAKAKGYQLISYISSKAITWPGLVVGDNCFIYENTIIKPFAEIGSNVMIEAGSMIGHHTIIKDHCFLSPNSVILGEVTVGAYCVVGANSTVREGTTIAPECIIGAGAVITRNTRESSVYLGRPAELLPGSSSELSVLLEERETH